MPAGVRPVGASVTRAGHRAPPVGAHAVVRLVAPSGTLVGHEAALEAGIQRLESAGCRVRFDERRATDCHRGYLAGEDAVRADELLSALAEPGVDIVWFARGGSGGGRTTTWVLDGAARLAPRHVVGFSDATTLLNGLAVACGWVTHHGPVVTSLGRPDVIAFDLELALERLRGADASRFADPAAWGHAPPLGDAAQFDDAVVCGDAAAFRDAPPLEGRLLGGNLTVLASLAGTSLFPRAPGTLWLLEDVAEAPYRLDRSLTQLRSAGLFVGAAGVWLGDLGLTPEETAGVERDFRRDLHPLRLLTGAPAGHRGPMALLPIGARVRLGAGGTWQCID